MESGFFQSREFVVAAVVAAIVVASGIAIAGTGPVAFGNSECTVQAPTGTAQQADVREDPPRREGADAVATATLRWPVAANETLRLRMCTEVGGITVITGADHQLTVTATLRLDGGDPEDLHLGPLRWRAAESGDGLEVAVFHHDLPDRLGFFESSSARLHYEVRLPAATDGLHVDLDVGVGDVLVSDVVGTSLSLATDVGDVEARRVTLTGDARLSSDVGDVSGNLTMAGLIARTDVGDIHLEVTPAASAAWSLGTDVGSIDVVSVRSDTIGYALAMSTDVGGIDADVGATESRDHRGNTGETLTLRTAGFSDASLQVTADVRTDVGSVSFVTR